MIMNMAGGKRICSTLIALVAILAGCSSGDTDASPPVSVEETSASPTTTSEPEPTTTATAEPSTSLSEQAEAEAEITQLVTDWWTTAWDSAKPDGGIEYLTGLQAQRTKESQAKRTEEGTVLVSLDGRMVIEITDTEVDLSRGFGSVNACHGSDAAIVDIESREPKSEPDDPSYQTTSEFVVELTADGWKISDWYSSYNTGEPTECEIRSR